MKKHSGTILLVLIFFVGLAVMLYPTISDYINQRNQTRVVNSYAQQVDGLSDADYTAYFDAADVFNQKIAADPDALYHADRFSTYSTAACPAPSCSPIWTGWRWATPSPSPCWTGS